MEPASIRTKNPGAMWPNAIATRFGSTSYENLKDGQGNKIAIFPTFEQGIAAEFALWSAKYSGMTLGAAIKKWSGSNSPAAYAKSLSQKTGLSMNDVITREMLSGPKGLAFMKAQSQWEAGRPYPATDEQWAKGQAMAFAALPPKPPSKAVKAHAAALTLAAASAGATTHAGLSTSVVVFAAIATAIVVYLVALRKG